MHEYGLGIYNTIMIELVPQQSTVATNRSPCYHEQIYVTATSWSIQAGVQKESTLYMLFISVLYVVWINTNSVYIRMALDIARDRRHFRWRFCMPYGMPD
jgi:hypothetical protein